MSGEKSLADRIREQAQLATLLLDPQNQSFASKEIRKHRGRVKRFLNPYLPTIGAAVALCALVGEFLGV